MSKITYKPSNAISKNPPARNEVIKNQAAKEINRLHSEIMSAAKTCLEKAIRIGEILAGQRQSLKHGEWLPWLEANIPFTDRTARNYIRCFMQRADLKLENVSNLAEAYRLLSAPADEQSAAQQLVEKVELTQGYDGDIQAWLKRVEEMPLEEIENTPAEEMTFRRGYAAVLRLVLAEAKQEGFWRPRFKTFHECCFAFVGEEYPKLLAKP